MPQTASCTLRYGAFGTYTCSRYWLYTESTRFICCMQALYSQRNIAANAQRKYTVSYTVVATGGNVSIVPGHPVELKDVLLYAPSPSGVFRNDATLVDDGL